HRMFGLTSLTIVTGTTGDNASVKLDALIPEDAEELNELLKREVETNIVNDNEHTLKEDQKTTHHYSMSFKEILLISLTSLYILAFIPSAFSGYVILDELFQFNQYIVSAII